MRLSRLHPVFPVVKLQLAEDDPFPTRPRHEEPPPVLGQGEGEEWEVEEILDAKMRYRSVWFRVRWKGYDPSHDQTLRSGLEVALTAMAQMQAKRDLHSTMLAPGTSMGDHIARMRSLWQRANEVGAAISDADFVSTFIGSLGEEWDAVVPLLYGMKTSVEVISFVTMHAARLDN
ncbi:unnamed protein product [Mycena citricolor]|uniref:Chromo domain-containing protein n=1 Tax=Mycena citricolor TaxID=2018698 RepID=A0AAD2H0N5_9AGAR|nr:unnamed protein product [Mycena citricolor]